MLKIITTKRLHREVLSLKEHHLKIGRDHGILAVLRYAKNSLSPAKFKEFDREFNFTALEQKYGQIQTPTRRYQRTTQENVTAQGNGSTITTNP